MCATPYEDADVFLMYQGEDVFHDNGKDVHGDDDGDDDGCNPTRALYSAGRFSRHNLHQPYITFGGSPAWTS